MKGLKEPNWDILLSSFDSAISNIWNDIVETQCKILKSITYCNGHFLRHNNYGDAEEMLETNKIRKEELESLLRRRDKVINHDMSFMDD